MLQKIGADDQVVAVDDAPPEKVVKQVDTAKRDQAPDVRHYSIVVV
jgi:hypothetical protein